MTDSYPLACPVCANPLQRTASTFGCSEGHSFDIAKEGYVNLLPPQHKTRGIEGDVPSMLQARRRFLDAGYFSPLREALADEVSAILGRAADRSRCVLDVGCGEGYYIGGVAVRVDDGVMLLGTDLSKSAVKLAAKRYRDALFFVADVHRHLYVRSGSVSVITDVFAPRNASEFARVLRPGGSVMVVIPASSHLASLRARLGLLDIQEEKERRVVQSFADHFVAVDRRELRYTLELPPDAVRDLVDMGPNHWHREQRVEAVAEEPAATEASFILLHFQRRAGAG